MRPTKTDSRLRSLDLKRLLFILICVSTFWIASYGLNIFNEQPSYDGLYIDSYEDTNFQLQQGRYCQPVYWQIRGMITSPPLLNFMAIVFLSCTCFCITKMLNMSRKIIIALSSIILAVNPANALLNASYTAWIDTFQLAFLLSILAISLLRDDGPKLALRIPLSIVLLIVSLALYQVYLSAFAFMAIVLLMSMIFNGATLQKSFAFFARCLIVGIIALLLYYLIWKALLNINDLKPATYNGYDSLGDFSEFSILGLLVQSYLYPVKYLLHPESFHSTISGVIDALILLSGVITAIIFAFRQKSVAKTITIVFAIILMPFALGCIYFISKGEFHSLMTQPFYLSFVCALASLQLWEKKEPAKEETASQTHPRAHGLSHSIICIVPICLAIVSLFNVVYANDVAVKRALIYQSTDSMMTRIMDRVETTHGYEMGKTPIMFIGEFSYSPIYGMRSPSLDKVNGIGLAPSSIAPNSHSFLRRWMHQKWGYPYIEPTAEEKKRVEESGELNSMDVFPASESVKLIDDVIAVKVSQSVDQPS